VHILSIKSLQNIYELENTQGHKRNLAMEGIRGIAVFLVFLVHYHAIFGARINANSLTSGLSFALSSIGEAGVDLFFVLSGYLIYGAVIKKRTKYTSFMRRRIQRIYPVFLCVFALYLIVSKILPSESKISSGIFAASTYIIENLLLLPGMLQIDPIIVVSWSLSYEFFYYLSLPLLVSMLRMRDWQARKRVLFFVALAFLFTAYCLIFRDNHIRLIMFISGIILYEAIHSYNVLNEATITFDYIALCLFIVTLPIIYILSKRPDIVSFVPYINIQGYRYRVVLLFFCFFVFVLACFRSRTLLHGIFSWAPLRWLGNMSYSYYLIHAITLKVLIFIMLQLIHLPKNSPILFWLLLPVSFSITLASSTVLFIIVEKRFSLKPVPATREPVQTMGYTGLSLAADQVLTPQAHPKADGSAD
jgi:exopolysaccharide production protein ExoZ